MGYTCWPGVPCVDAGDVIFLRGGDRCPADCHHVKGDCLSLDNSELTGESRLIKRPLHGCTVKAVRLEERGVRGQDQENAAQHDAYTIGTVAGCGQDDEEQLDVRRDQLLPLHGRARCAHRLGAGTAVSLVGCLAGGTVKQGEAYCVVDRTGLHTENGRAAGASKGPGKGAFQKSIEAAAAVYIAISLLFVAVGHHLDLNHAPICCGHSNY